MNKKSYFSENSINWKTVNKVAQLDPSDPLSLKHSIKDLNFNKLSINDLKKIPQHLIHKYFNLSKLAIDYYSSEKQSLDSELSRLEQDKSPNFLKKIQIESKLNDLRLRLTNLNSAYTHNKELLISKYEKGAQKNVGNIKNEKLTPCEFCKKVFESPEYYKKHIIRRHNTLQRLNTTDLQKCSSLENSLIQDFNNFTNDRIQKFLDLSKKNFESLKTLTLDASPSRSFNFSNFIEGSFSVKFDELRSFRLEKSRENQIFKLELENQMLKQRKSMLERGLEDIRKLKSQENFEIRRLEKGVLAKNKWKKWVSGSIDVKSKEKQEDFNTASEKFKENYEAQDQQDFFILEKLEKSMSHCESPNFSMIAFKPDNISNIDSIKSRLFSLFSHPIKFDAKYPESHFPISGLQFSQSRLILSQKFNQCVNHIKTDPSNLDQALTLSSQLFLHT